MVQYLLPCQCGRKTPVDSTKAGRTIECECGANLEVPTMGGLKNLQRVVDAKRGGSAATWGPRQRVLLVGILICVTGLGIAGFLWNGLPKPPPHEQRIDELIPQHVENLSLMQTLQLWGYLERGLPEEMNPEDIRYRKAHQTYIRLTGVALFITAVGVLVVIISLLLMIISLFFPKKRRRPRPQLDK